MTYPWNKGLAKETNDKIRQIGIKSGKTNSGHICNHDLKNKLETIN